MGALAANAAVAVAILLMGLSLLLAAVATVSYRRIGHARLLWIALAFAGFGGKGAWFLQDFWAHRGQLAASWGILPWMAVADLGIVVALYLAVLKD